ncbi:ABC transporter transmembrane domain-containing protein [Limnohabitans sp.]|uniref:ABC transporter transmembrane domain-containing protein n=1 Tax=Limnohabitans sp. TaxID=1907725 RepID=UPI0035B04EEE
MEFKDTIDRLWAYARPQWRMLAATLVFFLLSAVVEPLIPDLFRRLLDSDFKLARSYPLWVVPVAVVGLFAVRGVFSFMGTYTMNSATSSIVLALRRDLMRGLLRADAKLFTQISPGLAVTKIINDPQNAANGLGGSAVSALKDGTTLLFLLGYLFYLNWQLTLMSLVVMPLLALTIKVAKKRLTKVGGASYEAQQALVNTVDDNARAWRVVRTFDAADFELARFDKQAQRHRQMLMKTVVASNLVSPVTQLIAAVGLALIITLALVQTQNNAKTVGDFTAFIMAMLLAIRPMRTVTDLYQPIYGALIAARGAFELINAPPEIDLGTQELADCRGAIRFDHVSLQYEGSNTKALDNLVLDIAPGQTVALVGASGAGKSTIVSALLRFATPSTGQILLDHTPIEDLRLANLRSHFAVVSQDIVLFDGTIAENIAYASPLGIDRAKVERCLKAANLWSHVQTLPGTMDAGIGTNGGKLSGGQRQRLAIARALYRDAAIWIFDEATSALDSESEAVVQRSIEDLRHAKTLILIAHRLSTIKNADMICVMSEGRVIEKGTHAELLVLNGTYANMVRIQSAN